MVAMATVPMATRPSFSEVQHSIIYHLSKCSLNCCIWYGDISGINIYALIQHLTPFPGRIYSRYTPHMPSNPLDKDILKYAKPCCVPEDPIHMATSSSLLAIFSPYPALFSGFWKTSLFKLCLDSSESGLCSRNQIAPKTSIVAEAKMLKSIHGDIGSKGHTIVPSDFHWILPFGHQSDELSLYINGIVTYHFQLFYI